MELLSEEIIAQINQQVYARFPNIHGARPTLKRAPSGTNIILTYRLKSVTEDGFSIEQIVRATVTPAGQLVKVSASR